MQNVTLEYLRSPLLLEVKVLEKYVKQQVCMNDVRQSSRLSLFSHAGCGPVDPSWVFNTLESFFFSKTEVKIKCIKVIVEASIN